ncbi:MAG TPA: group I intron-associated PD-(D/E)XK endonuclease [Acidimicrobiia bacterium]|nr:group I intron-associated PD-(D/E)XK endonuclease [Acidimicrobiia bacterium]
MGITTLKGEIGEAMVIADLRKRGFGVAIPFGHDVPFDVILYRKDTGALERVQVKYTESDGKVIIARNQSNSDWVQYAYTADLVDWLAIYDATTDRCYYVPSSEFDGMHRMSLRLIPTANGQRRLIRWARDFLDPEPPPTRVADRPSLPFAAPPE